MQKITASDIELYPTRLDKAAVKTEAMLGITRTHLYVAFIAHDPNPKRFRSAKKERDSTRDDDYVSFVVDPAGQAAKKLEFRVSPHGTLSDVFQDTISDRYLYDWNTKWEGAAKIAEPGYYAELAIPLTSLKFTGLKGDKVRPGIAMFKRSYPKQVDSTFGYFFQYKINKKKDDETIDTGPVIDPDGMFSLFRSPSKLLHSDLFPPGDRLTIQSHLLYHFDQERSVGGEWSKISEHDEFSGGADIKYHLDPSRVATLSIKPNFVEVEEDIIRDSINNPFVPFLPEERAFFQEVGEYFATLSKVVYTRNIIEPEVGFSYLPQERIFHSGRFGSETARPM